MFKPINNLITSRRISITRHQEHLLINPSYDVMARALLSLEKKAFHITFSVILTSRCGDTNFF